MSKTQRFSLWVLLLLSAGSLLLRLDDFAAEALHQDFHMTRAGLHITGGLAFVLQLQLILMLSATSVFFARRLTLPTSLPASDNIPLP